MVLLPTLYTIPRGIHILASILIAIKLVNYRLAFNKDVILYTFGIVLLSLFAVVNGIIQGNDVIIALPMYVMWPLVFLFLINHKISKRDLQEYEYVIVFTSLFGCIFITFGVINIIIYGKSYLFSEIYPVEIGFVNGLPKFGSQFLPVLCFTIPFVFFSSLTSNNIKRYLYNLCFIFMLVFALFSGRSVFILVVILIMTISIIYFIKFRKKRRKLLANILLFVTLISVPLFSLKEESTKILSIFVDKIMSNENEELNSGRRSEQFNNIINRIQDNPVIGFGINAPESLNSNVFSFELTYLQLLLNFGTLGFSLIVIFNLAFLFLVIIHFKKCNNLELITPWIIGYISYMICAATNPILLKFDRIWLICIPIFLYCHRKKLVY